MKFAYTLTLALLTTACGPGPNVDSEIFRPEYDAVAAHLQPRRTLDEIDFYVAGSFAEMTGYCGDPDACNATYMGQGSIVLPPQPPNRCGYVQDTPKWRPQRRYSRVVIHEILHAQGLEHGALMAQLEAQAWETFRAHMCPHILPETPL